MSTNLTSPDQVIARFEHDFGAAMQSLERAGLLRYRAAGNISLRVPGTNEFLIANTNPPHAGQWAWLDSDLRVISGTLGPALREVAALHSAILVQRPDVNSVIHLHSPYLTGFAVAGRTLPNAYTPLVSRTDKVYPIAEWGPRDADGPLLQLLHDHPDAEAALHANHGPFAWAGSVAQATQLFITLEESAHVFTIAEQLGGIQPLPADAHQRVQQARRARSAER